LPACRSIAVPSARSGGHVYFWIIKILTTTVGETAADTLNMDLHFGLTNTTWVMSALLVAVMAVQLARDRYVPGVLARRRAGQHRRDADHR
jgi:uncharacterized membrane-anchored protein